MTRTAEITRKTAETDLLVHINLDGSGVTEVHTGIGFFDHMLDAFGRHGLFDLRIKAKGDLHVDGHHTVEDTGIALARPSRRRWAIEPAFAAMAMPRCPSTNRWCAR